MTFMVDQGQVSLVMIKQYNLQTWWVYLGYMRAHWGTDNLMEEQEKKMRTD